MKLVSFSIALLLCPTIAAASPVRSLPALQGAAAAPQVTGTKEERATAAAAYYSQGDFVRAALGFEGLHVDYPQDRNFLFNAAASRHAAGHEAHAVAYTQEYLALASLAPEDRKEAQVQLQESEAGVATLSVTVSAATGEPAAFTLVARHVARESGDIRPELSFPASSGAPTTLKLDPGVWTIHARGEGYVDSEQRVELTRGGAPPAISLEMARTPVADSTPVAPQPKDFPPAVARRSLLGFSAVGGITAVTGAVVLGVGAAGVGKASTCTSDNQTPCTDKLRDGLLLRDLGVTVLGAGVGLLVGGATWKARSAATRRKAWIAEAAAGGAALIAGMVLVPMTLRGFNKANDADQIPADGWTAHHDAYRHSAGHAVGSLLFGLGVGTLVSAGTSLGIQRKHTGKLQVGGMAGRGQLGLTLSGRF